MVLSKSPKESKKDKILSALLCVITFIVGFGLCCFIKYSDGDDAFFIKVLGEHPSFIDFVSYLTRTMNGRITTTCSLWLVFSNSILLWRVLNAAFLSTFVFMLTKITKAVCDKAYSPMISFVACAGFAVMGIGIFGYSCLWITGSVNYLWPAVTALISIYPFLKSAFYGYDGVKKFEWLISTVTGVYTLLAQEQFAAITVCSVLLLIIFGAVKSKRVRAVQIIMLILFVAAFALLLMSPANEARADKEAGRWLPDYVRLNLAQKLFLGLQWIAHSLSHSLKWIYALMWAGIAVVGAKNKHYIRMAVGALFVALCGASLVFKQLTDVGLDGLDMTEKVDHAPLISDVTAMQLIVIAFWLVMSAVAVLVVCSELKQKNTAVTVVVIYSAAMASMGIMIFSPTIYASGERALFAAAILLLIIDAIIIARNKNVLLRGAVVCACAGLQLIGNYRYIMEMI